MHHKRLRLSPDVPLDVSASAAASPALRRSRAIAAAAGIVALLLALAPLVSADGRGKRGDDEERRGLGGILDGLLGSPPPTETDPKPEPREVVKKAPESRTPAPAPRVSAPQSGAPLAAASASVGLGIAGFALLGCALVLGRVASKPRRPRLAPFDAGRRRAMRAAPAAAADAVQTVTRAKLGKVVEARAIDDAAWVSLLRKRKVSCGEVSGFLAGAFESAWGRDVEVHHVECGGRKRKLPCRYEVRAVRRDA